MGWPRESSVSALGSWMERDSLDGEAQAVFLAPFSLPVVGTEKGDCAPKGDVPGCSSLVSGGVGLSPTWLWGPLCGGRSPGCSARPDEEHVLGETGVLPTLSSTKVLLGAERKDGETVWVVGK